MIPSQAVKQPRHEVNHSPPSSAKVKNDESYIPALADMPAWHGASFSTVTLALPFSMQLHDVIWM
jgi:hypothetical protein